jgi:hypothetical protein
LTVFGRQSPIYIERIYVDLPADAVVLSVDRKSQIQPFDRTQPGLPMMKPGRAGTMTHDYKRHGTKGIEPSRERDQQGLSDISDTVSGHRRTVAEIGKQESARCFLRLPAQKAEPSWQQNIVDLR